MTRALILLGITALACRGSNKSKPATPGSAAPVGAPVTTVSGSVTPGGPAPSLPAIKAEGSGAIADRYAAEDVDDAWKSRTEADLKKRYAKMQHPPSETACRASMCRLTITGSPEQLAASIDELQVLRNNAQSLLLTRPADGKIVAYLQYERAD